MYRVQLAMPVAEASMVLTAIRAAPMSLPSWLAAGVEAEPTERQDHRPEDDHGNVVGREDVDGPVLVVFADAGAEDHDAGQAQTPPVM